MPFATADLSDHHGSEVQVAEPIFRSFGSHARFRGAVYTLRVLNDNSLVREALEQPGLNRVLVVDGGGSLSCALVGDQLADLAVRNGWAGILVNGCIRDSREISRLSVGIKALNTHPRKSVKKGEGERNVGVTFAGVTFEPGHFVYSDEDGILVSTRDYVGGK